MYPNLLADEFGSLAEYYIHLQSNFERTKAGFICPSSAIEFCQFRYRGFGRIEHRSDDDHFPGTKPCEFEDTIMAPFEQGIGNAEEVWSRNHTSQVVAIPARAGSGLHERVQDGGGHIFHEVFSARVQRERIAASREAVVDLGCYTCVHIVCHGA